MHPVSTLYFRFGGACIAESCSVLQVVRATYLPTTHALTHARTHARPEQELRFSVGSAEERALLLETLDALRKRAAAAGGSGNGQVAAAAAGRGDTGRGRQGEA